MKLREALEIIHAVRPGGPHLRYLLGCSSTPTHLQTFLRAFLVTRQPAADVQVETLPYGDLAGGLETRGIGGYAGAAVVCEWYDLDPRLGFRRLGGWAPSSFSDILETVQAGLARLRAVVERLSGEAPVALSLPTLPLPPLEIAAPPQALDLETRLNLAVWSFAEWCASRKGVRLLSPAELDRRSPPAERFDLRADISQGSPYRLGHAAAVAELLSRLLAPEPPLKGLITDLDDTMWKGILGEVGPAGVSFTLQDGAQIHGLYQQFLQSLAERGVLLGIATKNDPALVARALARPDLLVKRDSFFPIEAHWAPKSESVGRILKAWNIGPEAIAFVDDSPMEAAEVQSRFPEVRCLAFPANEPPRLLELFDTLRHCYGKRSIRAEDRLRTESLRATQAVDAAQVDPAAREAFLTGLGARVRFQLSRDPAGERAFELLNKTNQFNLNGRRLSEAEWRHAIAEPDSFLLTVEYSDKFGPLGEIAVVMGRRRGPAATITSWAMSCRAFSRRIEHATMANLFERLDVETISLEFAATDRNGPMREFLASLGIVEDSLAISRSGFDSRCPRLSFTLEDLTAHV